MNTVSNLFHVKTVGQSLTALIAALLTKNTPESPVF